jgi:hypothetical protein
MPPANSTDSFEDDRHDAPRRTRRRRDPDHRRPQKRSSVPLMLIVCGAGIGLMVLLATGVALFFVLNLAKSARGTAPAPTVDVPQHPRDTATASGTTTPPTKITTPTSGTRATQPARPAPPPVDRPKPKDQPPASGEDRKCVVEAKAEYATAVQEKERRAKAYKVRLGSLDKAEYELATELLKGIQAEGLDAFPEEFIRKAEVLAPDYIAALRRERVISNPDYPELVKNGAYPKYHPTAKRKELYAEFAAATGDKAEWSVSRPFAALT